MQYYFTVSACDDLSSEDCDFYNRKSKDQDIDQNKPKHLKGQEHLMIYLLTWIYPNVFVCFA